MPIFVGVRGLNYFSCSVIISPLICITVFLALCLFLAAAAAVTELLLITGGTDTAFTCFTVIGRSAGVGQFIICIF